MCKNEKKNEHERIFIYLFIDDIFFYHGCNGITVFAMFFCFGIVILSRLSDDIICII